MNFEGLKVMTHLPWKLMSTTTQIFLDTQGTQEGVRDIKVREHFQFHHLVGDVQKGLGIHIFNFPATYPH